MQVEITGETAEWITAQLELGRFESAARAMDFLVRKRRDEDTEAEAAPLRSGPLTHVGIHPDDAAWIADYRDRLRLESADAVVRRAIHLLREQDTGQPGTNDAEAPPEGSLDVPEPEPEAAGSSMEPAPGHDVDLDHELFAAVRERIRARGPQVF